MIDANFLIFAISEKRRQLAISGNKRLELDLVELYRRLLECEQ